MGFNSKTQKRKMKLLAALTALTSAIDPLMLMMMSGGMGGSGMDIGSNPILLLQLLKGDSGSSGLKDLLPLMMMSGGMGGMGAGMGAGGMQGMLPLLLLMVTILIHPGHQNQLLNMLPSAQRLLTFLPSLNAITTLAKSILAAQPPIPLPAHTSAMLLEPPPAAKLMQKLLAKQLLVIQAQTLVWMTIF